MSHVRDLLEGGGVRGRVARGGPHHDGVDLDVDPDRFIRGLEGRDLTAGVVSIAQHHELHGSPSLGHVRESGEDPVADERLEFGLDRVECQSYRLSVDGGGTQGLSLSIESDEADLVALG